MQGGKVSNASYDTDEGMLGEVLIQSVKDFVVGKAAGCAFRQVLVDLRRRKVRETWDRPTCVTACIS